MNYIPLDIKTEYDLMNSLIKLDDLILYAQNNGIKALGITDKNMFGAYEFIQRCNKNNIKPIIGIEVSIDEDSLLIYAKNYDGYVALCNIVSKCNIDGISIEDIKKYSPNIIVVTDYKTYNKYKDMFSFVYIKYSNEEERKNASAARKSLIGTGDRSEKIRTYNYPQNRVTDHRIGFTIQKLDRVIEGELDEVIEALIHYDQSAKMAGE